MANPGFAFAISAAAAHGSCWQLSGPSWTRMRLPGAAGGTALAAARRANAGGPLPLGLSLSLGGGSRSAAPTSGAAIPSTSLQSLLRRWPNETSPTRASRLTFANDWRKASRARANLEPRSVPRLPHMEPEPAKTTTAAGLDCAPAGAWAVTGNNTRGREARRTSRTRRIRIEASCRKSLLLLYQRRICDSEGRIAGTGMGQHLLKAELLGLLRTAP